MAYRVFEEFGRGEESAGGLVVAMVADVGNREDRARRNLMFHRKVPAIDHGQPNGVIGGQRQHVRRDPIGQERKTIGTLGPVARMAPGSSTAPGPLSSVNTENHGLAGLIDWLASTGKFWVTICPNE